MPKDTSLHGSVPDLRHVYLPAAHRKALHPDCMVVEGMRGAGKSFWWATLQKPEHRRALGDQIKIDERAIISTGFGERSSPDDYPRKDAVARILKQITSPHNLWKTVVLHHVGQKRISDEFKELKYWNERARWVEEHPEEVERCLFETDAILHENSTYHIVMFDALDRTADEWRAMHDLTRGLLQLVLEFRSFRRLRLKIFIRPDQIESAEVATFPDASKVLAGKTELEWPRNELYGLLWQYLANAKDEGNVFRDEMEELFSTRSSLFPPSFSRIGPPGLWNPSESLRHDESLQREVFHAITGPWMGRDVRRGFPYTWLPNHLGDVDGRVSPRSFLAALRVAAEDRPRENHEYALHYESIKRGVQEASRIRVREIEEDYPWVKTLMEPLAGLTIPCPFEDIKSRWREGQALESLERAMEQTDVRLPPARIDQGAPGVLEDLRGLGLFQTISKGRVNVPDVYRIGYGLGRRGGVKPVE